MLDGVVTTVDAVNGAATADRQAEALNSGGRRPAVMTKNDLAAAGVTDALRPACRSNPAAEVSVVAQGGSIRRHCSISVCRPRAEKRRGATLAARRKLRRPGPDHDDHGHHHTRLNRTI